MNKLKPIKMRRFVIICILMLGWMQVTAQVPERSLTPEQKEQLKERMVKYMDALNLSEPQKEPYRVIVAKYADQMRFVQASELSKQEKLKEIQAMQSHKDAEMKALLSKEQYQVYVAFKEEQRQLAMTKISDEFAAYKERLHLTDDQIPAFNEISAKARDALSALKSSSKSRFSKYKAYKKIQKDKHKDMKALLTSEQYEVYLEIEEEVQKAMKERRSKN